LRHRAMAAGLGGLGHQDAPRLGCADAFSAGSCVRPDRARLRRKTLKPFMPTFARGIQGGLPAPHCRAGIDRLMTCAARP
jgi:hypothetical protein